jgi:deoxyribodipyrimidine photolyase
VIGRDYPARVVEHAKAREVALALFKKTNELAS